MLSPRRAPARERAGSRARPAIGGVDDRPAAGRAVEEELVVGHLLVEEPEVVEVRAEVPPDPAQVVEAHRLTRERPLRLALGLLEHDREVDEDVLVRQGDAHVLRADRTEDGLGLSGDRRVRHLSSPASRRRPGGDPPTERATGRTMGDAPTPVKAAGRRERRRRRPSGSRNHPEDVEAPGRHVQVTAVSPEIVAGALVPRHRVHEAGQHPLAAAEIAPREPHARRGARRPGDARPCRGALQNGARAWAVRPPQLWRFR